MNSFSPLPVPANAPSAEEQYLGFLDFLKAVASQLIVLHHLAFYGPMSDHVEKLAPRLLSWLEGDARIAVQLFLVMGGFLAAKALAPRGVPTIVDPIRIVLRRFTKLVLPYLAAILLAVVASELARLWMTHDSISAVPTLQQIIAHALLLHSVLEYESLSAGIWYIAIDFQLYALLTLLLWLAGRFFPAWSLPVIVGAGMTASLLYFNRDSDWDVWALYFLGSYGLGVLAWWASERSRSNKTTLLLIAVMVIPTLVALVIDFRSRIAVALATALLLVVVMRSRPAFGVRQGSLIAYLGRISYAVFLVHFPVCLVVNAVFTRFLPSDPWVQAGGMLLAWMSSVAAGAAFHHWVESPLGRLRFFPKRVKAIPPSVIQRPPV